MAFYKIIDNFEADPEVTAEAWTHWAQVLGELDFNLDGIEWLPAYEVEFTTEATQEQIDAFHALRNQTYSTLKDQAAARKAEAEARERAVRASTFAVTFRDEPITHLGNCWTTTPVLLGTCEGGWPRDEVSPYEVTFSKAALPEFVERFTKARDAARRKYGRGA
ncbi:MAG: hypothetical protein ABW252_12630 [Polyangiales bacterium]